jgi:hypothetical protein
MLKNNCHKNVMKKECKKASKNDSKVNTNTKTCQKPARPEEYYFFEPNQKDTLNFDTSCTPSNSQLFLVASKVGNIFTFTSEGQPGACSSHLRRVCERVRPLWILCTYPFPAFLEESISSTLTHDPMVTRQQLYRCTRAPILYTYK